ncbi:hypothetical protein B7486_62465, partial [cyanobacterium TDX16]
MPSWAWRCAWPARPATGSPTPTSTASAPQEGTPPSTTDPRTRWPAPTCSTRTSGPRWARRSRPSSAGAPSRA